MGIFKRSFADISNAISIGGVKGGLNSLAIGITQQDIANINEYNRLVSVAGLSSQTAWNRTMLASSETAQKLFDNQENLVKSGEGLVLSQEAIANATQTMTVKAKLATVGFKALAIAGNMLLFAGISISDTDTVTAACVEYLYPLSLISSRTFATAVPPCCWLSRTQRWLWVLPTAATFSRTAVSFWRIPVVTSLTTTTCVRPIWARRSKYCLQNGHGFMLVLFFPAKEGKESGKKPLLLNFFVKIAKIPCKEGHFGVK